MTDAAATPLDAPRLLCELKQLVRSFVAVFGDPAALYTERAMLRRDALALIEWLRAMERLTRALLVTLAARLPRPAPVLRASTSPALRKQISALRTRRDAEDHGDGGTTLRSPTEPSPDQIAAAIAQSERWTGVSFRALVARPGRASGAARSTPWRFVETRPLAYRLEALIRVVQDPERYARRLAKRLWAEPLASARALAPMARPGFARTRFTELAEEARPLAVDAARAFWRTG
jgi:hypothetical protein